MSTPTTTQNNIGPPRTTNWVIVRWFPTGSSPAFGTGDQRRRAPSWTVSTPCPQLLLAGGGGRHNAGFVWRHARRRRGRPRPLWPVRLGGRPPLPPDQAVHPRVRHLAVHDAVSPQRPLTHEPELLEDARRCRVARVGLGVDSIQVQRIECPLVQGARGLRRVAVAPDRIIEAAAQGRTAVVPVPSGETKTGMPGGIHPAYRLLRFSRSNTTCWTPCC